MVRPRTLTLLIFAALLCTKGWTQERLQKPPNESVSPAQIASGSTNIDIADALKGLAAHVYHFSGSPCRGGVTRTVRKLKAETEKRIVSMGGRLMFDGGGHFKVREEYIEKIIKNCRSGEFSYLCLIGYSWGACITDLAAALGEKGIPVDLMIYIDPLNWSKKGLSYGDVPANVRQAYRFYTGDLFMHSRRDIAPMDPGHTTCTNIQLATPWYLWPIPLGRHIYAPSRLTNLIPELIALGVKGDLPSFRFTKVVSVDRSGSPVYRVGKASGWMVAPADTAHSSGYPKILFP